MTTMRALRFAAAAATALLPLVAAAEEEGGTARAAQEEPVYDNRISPGVGYQSADSFRFGRYTGLTKQGALGIGAFSLRGHDEWSSGGTNYWSAEGLNLGLPSRSFDLQYGNQGSYGIQFYYDGIPYYYSDSFHTIYDRSGTGALNGAPSSATPWYNSAALAPFINTQELKTQRDIFSGSVDYKPPQSDWQVTTSFRHDHKEGTQEGSLVFGTGKSVALQGTVPTGTSGNLIFFPMPISYDIDRYDAKVAHNGQDIQAEFGYTYSGFTDNNTSFNAIDPFASPAPIPVGSFFSNPSGNNLGPPGTLIRAAYSLPPSNSAHYVKGTVGYNLTPATRLVGTLQYGLQLQNAAYTPDTLNTFLLGKNLFSHPGSLDGQVRTLFGNATLTSQPLDKLDLKASYTIDKRDNDTAKQLIQSTYVDSFQTYANAIGTPAAALGVPNFIYSSDIQTAKLEAGYRVLPKTKVTLGYTYKNTQRTLSDVNHLQENSALVRVNSALPLALNGNLFYEHSVRSGNYNGLIPWQYLGYTTNENNPTAFFEAARTRDAIKGRMSASSSDSVSVGLETRFANNRYSNANFGLTNDHTLSAGPDVGWTPIENLNLHAFYTYEQIFRDDAGQISITNPTGPATLGRWSQSSRDNTHTLGVAGDWQVTPELKIDASYNFAYGDVLYSLADGLTTAQSLILANQGNVIQPLPDVKSKLHSVTIHGEYKFTPQVSLWMGYTFERFIYSDYALAAYANVLQYGNSLYPGYANPSYSVQVVGAALHIRF